MKVLFSSSEAKSITSDFEPLNANSLIFPDLYHKRLEMLSQYQSLVNESKEDGLKKLFGVSKEQLIEEYKKINIFKNDTQKAVIRYDGVGYKNLDYISLDFDSQKYIDENVLIFSNLFGPILAKDEIPFYKLKSTKKLGDIMIDKFYKQMMQEYLDEFIGDSLIVDLRANSFDGFYDVSNYYHVKVKFLKDGKMLSHYSKAYRGKFLREMSKREKLRDIHHLLTMKFEDMRYVDVIDSGKETTIIYEIF